MAQVTVNTQQLRNVASQLRQMNSRFGQEVSTLRSNQRTLTSQWDGPSNDEFDRSFNRNAGEFDNFRTLIDEYIRALENFCSEYERMENDNRRIAPTR